MKLVSMREHTFTKQNLVTISGKSGDHYKCQECGVSGYRAGLSEFVKLTEKDAKKAEKCPAKQAHDKENGVLPKKVLINDMIQFGLKYGIHDVVPCPDQYKDRFQNDVWIYSEERGEPVRLFNYEYEPVWS